MDSLTTVRKLKEKGIEVYFEKENIYTQGTACNLAAAASGMIMIHKTAGKDRKTGVTFALPVVPESLFTPLWVSV